MIRVIPRWLIEYGCLEKFEEQWSYRLNVDSMYEALQHFSKLNHGIKDISWLRITREADPQQTGTFTSSSSTIISGGIPYAP